MFSKTCEYAIRIMIYLWYRDYRESQWAGVKEIAEAIDTPVSFTAKVSQALAKGGLLNSMRGPHGGFSRIKTDNVTLADIVTVIDGPKIMKKCIIGFQDCSTEHPCPLHQQFTDIRDKINEMLKSTDMGQLKKMMSEGRVFIT